MREEVDVPPFASQEFEIADRRLRAGKNDKRGVPRQRLPRSDHDQLNARLRAKRIEVVEIGDARQQRDRDPDAPPTLTRLAALGTLSRNAGEGQCSPFPFPPPQAGEG